MPLPTLSSRSLPVVLHLLLPYLSALFCSTFPSVSPRESLLLLCLCLDLSLQYLHHLASFSKLLLHFSLPPPSFLPFLPPSILVFVSPSEPFFSGFLSSPDPVIIEESSPCCETSVGWGRGSASPDLSGHRGDTSSLKEEMAITKTSHGTCRPPFIPSSPMDRETTV